MCLSTSIEHLPLGSIRIRCRYDLGGPAKPSRRLLQVRLVTTAQTGMIVAAVKRCMYNP